jgi:hypothetical protein
LRLRVRGVALIAVVLSFQSGGYQAYPHASGSAARHSAGECPAGSRRFHGKIVPAECSFVRCLRQMPVQRGDEAFPSAILGTQTALPQ